MVLIFKDFNYSIPLNKGSVWSKQNVELPETNQNYEISLIETENVINKL